MQTVDNLYERNIDVSDFSFNYKRIFNDNEAEQRFRDNWDEIDWNDDPNKYRQTKNTVEEK